MKRKKRTSRVIDGITFTGDKNFQSEIDRIYRKEARARLKAIPGKAGKSRTFNIFGLKIPF